MQQATAHRWAMPAQVCRAVISFPAESVKLVKSQIIPIARSDSLKFYLVRVDHPIVAKGRRNSELGPDNERAAWL
jgi:hypothetical protein